MDAESMGLGLAILIACGVAVIWLIAVAGERSRKR
jgi:hypothetical protein